MILVVARHEENIDWLERVAGWVPLVVQKGRDLPNEGREGSSFLWAMERLYDETGRVAFVQGNPFPHAPRLVEQLQEAREGSGFSWLGDPVFVSEADGSPWHEGLPVRDKQREWFGTEWDGPVVFAAGGQFVIDAEQLRSRPRDFYGRLAGEMSHGENPWVMERLWERLFR